MKRLSIAVFLMVVALAGGVRAQNGYELLQQAVSKEQVDGNLKEAIAIYQRIVRDFRTDRALVAKALVQMGRAYEKLGSAEARGVYTRVIREFADQPQLIAEARSRLASLEQPMRNATGSRPARTGFSTVQIWGGPNVGAMGSMSADGRYLSFTDWHNAGGDLAVRDLTTGAQRRLTNKDSGGKTPSGEFAEFSAMSGDGSQVAYAWFTKEQNYEMRVIATSGGQPRTLYSNPEVVWLQPLDWSPDGTLVAAVFKRRDRTHQIVVITVADGTARILKTTDWRTPETIAFSRDGRFIAYDFPPGEAAGQRDIYVMAVDGSREVDVVNHAADDKLLGWFPSGDRLLFASDRAGSTSAWALPVREGRATGPPELIKPDVGRILPIGFSDAGDFYYFARVGIQDVFTVALEPSTGKAASPPAPLSHRSGGEKVQAVWSPDGERLLYGMRPTERVGGLPRLLGILSLKTGSEQILPLALKYVQWPAWSRDGQSVIAQGPDFKGQGGLHRIDLASGAMERVTDEGRLQPASARDGKTLFFFEQLAVTGGTLQIVARDMTTGQHRTVCALPGVAGFALSPDGQSLAINLRARRAEGGATVAGEIQLVSTAGGEPRTLLVTDDPLDFCSSIDCSSIAITWTADGKFILFTKGTGVQNELWRVPSSGGSAERVGVALPRIQRVSAHPDGKTLAISAGVPKFEVWALENVPGAAAKATRTVSAKR